jgi:hypothetical protein
MKAPWRLSSSWFPWLVLLLILLSIAFLSKEGIWSFELLKVNREAIEAAAKIIETIVLIIGGILAYIRFFKGRTLKAKLIINTSSAVYRVENALQHCIDIEIQNTGAVAIWNYRLEIVATIHSEKEENIKITKYAKLPGEIKQIERLIDVGESAYEQAFLDVPLTAFAVTYQIVVFDQNDAIWNRALTVENVVSKRNVTNRA